MSFHRRCLNCTADRSEEVRASLARNLRVKPDAVRIKVRDGNSIELRLPKAVQRSALCRPRRELSNAYFLAKFGFDPAENEPCQVCKTEQRCCTPCLRRACWKRTRPAARSVRPPGRHSDPWGRVRGGRVWPALWKIEALSRAERPKFGEMLPVFGCIGTDFCN